MSLVADWATTAALLAVLLAEGVRRLPAGAIVLRRTIRGSWRIVHGPTARTEWRLVSIWAPFFEHLVVRADTAAGFLPFTDVDGDGGPAPELPSRLTIGAFRAIGGVVLLVVALGVPVATASYGVAGFSRSVALAFICATIVALAMAAWLARAGGGWKSALGSAAPLLSPFAAPRAAELLLQMVVNRLAAPYALQAFVQRETSDRWFRTLAYDTLAASSSAPGRRSATPLEAIIAAVPETCGDGDRFCPRCAAVFLPHVEECSDCTSVVLRQHDAAGEVSGGVANPEWSAFPTGSRAVPEAAWIVTHARGEVGRLRRGRG